MSFSEFYWIIWLEIDNEQNKERRELKADSPKEIRFYVRMLTIW